MVQDTSPIETKDRFFYDKLRSITEWENRIEYLCSSALNYDAAMMYGKKIQRCQNNAYILKQGNTFVTYSESQLVSGLLYILSIIYNENEIETIQIYQPKFLELLVDIVPDQTILNLIKAFREA